MPKLVIATDQQLFVGYYAALRYSLIRPPRTCPRSIRALISTTRPGWQRGFLLQSLVRTVGVVVPGVLGEYLPQVLLAEDQQVV